MNALNRLPEALVRHRVRPSGAGGVSIGRVRYAPGRSLWYLAMAAGGLAGAALAPSWTALLVALGLALLFQLAHTLGMHRKLAHRSFECPRWVEYMLVYLAVLRGTGGPIAWLREHELRDYAERLPDCHPWLRHGASARRDAWWQLHGRLELRDPPFVRIESAVANDLFYRALERTWRWQQVALGALLYAWGGWSFVAWGVGVRVAATLYGQWLCAWLAHNRGTVHYEVRMAAVQGHNQRWAWLASMGECFHNNHHAYPESARIGLYPGEWDPGWWALRALCVLRLARDVRVAEDLPRRVELANIDYCELPELAPHCTGD